MQIIERMFDIFFALGPYLWVLIVVAIAGITIYALNDTEARKTSLPRYVAVLGFALVVLGLVIGRLTNGSVTSISMMRGGSGQILAVGIGFICGCLLSWIVQKIIKR